MIIFDLICKKAHRFEGWFQSQSVFDQQIANKQISCPDCGDTEIRRVPSATRLITRGDRAETAAPSKSVVSPQSPLTLLQDVVANLIANSEDVGKEFAREARKIHYMDPDASKRPIRGEASSEEFEMLQDEGIDILRLPVLKKESLN